MRLAAVILVAASCTTERLTVFDPGPPDTGAGICCPVSGSSEGCGPAPVGGWAPSFGACGGAIPTGSAFRRTFDVHGCGKNQVVGSCVDASSPEAASTCPADVSKFVADTMHPPTVAHQNACS